MADIFICYSRKDKTIASKLVKIFKDRRWSVFIDVTISRRPIYWIGTAPRIITACASIYCPPWKNFWEKHLLKRLKKIPVENAPTAPLQKPQLKTIKSFLASNAFEHPAKSFRDTLRNGEPGPEMVVIPAVRFLMGANVMIVKSRSTK
jgi:hypothetical protein